MIPSDIISKKEMEFHFQKDEIKWFISSYLRRQGFECSNVITFNGYLFSGAK